MVRSVVMKRGLFSILLAALSVTASARADLPPAPPSAVYSSPIGATLTQAQAVAIFRTRGLDLLIADAAMMNAEGDVAAADHVPNPYVSVAAGPAFNYQPDTPNCVGCAKYSLGWAIGDNGAILDSVSNKRGLRLDVARHALAVARLYRLDAQRVLESSVKQAYVQVQAAKAQLDLTRSMLATLQRSLDLARLRYPQIITEADLARTEVQKLEGDAAVTNAVASLRMTQAQLAFLLGERTIAPDFAVDPLDFSVPASLENSTETDLVALGLRSRPDLRAREYDRTRALAFVELAERQQVPNVALSLQYSAVGSGRDAASPSVLVINASATLPIFYQQGGEIMRAEADVTRTTLSQAKAESIVAADVGQAYAAYVSFRHMVERMRVGGLLDRARTARDILELQYRAGSASLVNYLDAQRTYIATNQEFIGELAGYWVSIDQLEQAVGTQVQ